MHTLFIHVPLFACCHEWVTIEYSRLKSQTPSTVQSALHQGFQLPNSWVFITHFMPNYQLERGFIIHKFLFMQRKRVELVMSPVWPNTPYSTDMTLEPKYWPRKISHKKCPSVNSYVNVEYDGSTAVSVVWLPEHLDISVRKHKAKFNNCTEIKSWNDWNRIIIMPSCHESNPFAFSSDLACSISWNKKKLLIEHSSAVMIKIRKGIYINSILWTKWIRC